MSDDDLAQRQAAGLRALADTIEAHPEIAQHVQLAVGWMGAHVMADEVDTVFPAFIRAMKASGVQIRKDYGEKYAHVSASFGPITLKMQAMREDVCERVVTGTEVIRETVPDPEKLAEVPTVEVTKTVETYRWNCKPYLADSPAATS